MKTKTERTQQQKKRREEIKRTFFYVATSFSFFAEPEKIYINRNI
jgi:hypothetical protein